MKKTVFVLLAAALSITGCKKEATAPIKNTADAYALSDFIDSRATDPTASRSNTISPKSDMKAIIRKVANTTDQYRLILKIDSVEIEDKDLITGVISPKMVDMETLSQITITAGLSIPDPINPVKETVFFTKGSMQFTKQNENGFYVYASAPFVGPSGTTDEPNGFAYELVKITPSIVAWYTFDDVHGLDQSRMVDINDTHSCFIIPSGKAIEQNPTVEKTIAFLNTAKEIQKIEVTISGDPAQETESLTFVPNIILKDPKDPKSGIQLPSVQLVKTQFNQNAGVAKFETSGPIVWPASVVSGGVSGKLKGNGKNSTQTMEFMVEDFRYKVDHK
jgi:hypothetical protein